jgi:precorrin-3B C17-methyltransferase
MIKVVGIGAGGKTLTIEAAEALSSAEVVIGAVKYVDMVRSLVRGQVIESEIDRVESRVEAALSLRNKRVVVISSGDPLVYGMGSRFIGIPGVEFVPGITAASLAANLLGWPLDDFATVSASTYTRSLSDIIRKIETAIAAGFRLAIYNLNPRTRYADASAIGRTLRARAPNWEYALVRNARREGQSIIKGRVADLRIEEADMNSVLLLRP